ncbi:MAG: FecCD family ABC transporter permease [Gemmatimonadota bacterium]
MRRVIPFAIAGALLVASAMTGLLLGPASLTPAELWRAVVSGEETPARTILLAVRLPRVTAGILTGASLAVSGALFQALLRNPLAEPYLLGVQSGAALGAVAAITVGMSALGAVSLPLAAFAGAVLAIALVFRVASSVGRLDTRILLLAGVVAGAFFTACVMLLFTLASARALQSAIFWTMGSLGQASWRMTAIVAAYALPAVVASVALGRHLNALALGEETAAHLGTEVERVKRLAYLLASFLAAIAVSVAGVIGFVGLVVPHAVRMLWGADHRRLIPLSFLGGGAVLVAADSAARTAAAPLEIPVGVVMAFVGVPFFLVLLRRRYVR